jgi:hypothetical protein
MLPKGKGPSSVGFTFYNYTRLMNAYGGVPRDFSVFVRFRKTFVYYIYVYIKRELG